MSRIVSVWLRAWPIARLLSAQASGSPADAIEHRRPLVLVAPGKGARASSRSTGPREPAASWRASFSPTPAPRSLDLQTRDADPAADAAALRRLALWCLRYTPIAAPWDECERRRRAVPRHHGLRASVRRGGAAAGRSRAPACGPSGFSRARRSPIRLGPPGRLPAMARTDATIVASGDESRRPCKPLPLAALRLGEEACSSCAGWACAGSARLIDQPRAPFAARFQAELLRRLDQALGHAPEPLVPVVEPPVYRAQATFAEPILSPGARAGGGTRTCSRLSPRPGARCRRRPPAAAAVVPSRSKTRLSNDSDGVAGPGLAAPSRDARHIAQLIGLRLHRLGSELEADFGFEAAAVHVLVAESLAERQDRLAVGEASIPPEEPGAADRPAAAAPGQRRRAPAASPAKPYPRARRARGLLPLSCSSLFDARGEGRGEGGGKRRSKRLPLT